MSLLYHWIFHFLSVVLEECVFLNRNNNGFNYYSVFYGHCLSYYSVRINTASQSDLHWHMHTMFSLYLIRHGCVYPFKVSLPILYDNMILCSCTLVVVLSFDVSMYVCVTFFSSYDWPCPCCLAIRSEKNHYSS